MSVKQEAIKKMIERLAPVLGMEAAALSEETAFADLPMKSVHYSQLTTFLEDAFDVEVPYMDFKRKKTIAEAAEYIVHLTES